MSFSPIDAAAPWSQAWTLASPLRFQGVGLHSGQPAEVRLSPAPAGHGYVFRRTDLPGQPEIPARAEQVTETRLSTTLCASGASVHTVEHLLAALWGMGVSDALITLDGPEVPVLDGSALPYVEALLNAGVAALSAQRVFLDLPVEGLIDGDKALSTVPAEDARVTYVVDYGHPLAGPQIFQCSLTPATFAAELAGARTFGFAHEVEALRAAGLARGGSIENAIVIEAAGYSSPLRFPDELVRHKALDLVGDLALLGGFWRGHVLAVKAGHALHNALARRLAARVAPAVAA